MLGFLIVAVALAMFAPMDKTAAPAKTQKVVYVYEHVVTEDQPIPFTVTDSIVVKEEIIP